MQELRIQTKINMFCEALNKIIDILDDHSQQVFLKEKYAVLLSGCFIGFYEDILSAEILAKNYRFFSLLKIARSLYDLALQLSWIKTLESEKQLLAIETFLSFSGKDRNNKFVHEWYKIIDSKMNMKKMEQEVKLGYALFSPDMSIILPPDLNNGEALGIYDCLSKALHWSPLFLKAFIGIKDGEFQAKEGSHIVAIHVGTLAIRTSAFIFTSFWLELFPDENISHQLSEILFPKASNALGT